MCVIITLSFCTVSYAATPMNIERKTVNGNEYIVKTFTMAQNVDVSSLIETDFNDGGYSFRYISSDKKENISESTKSITETETLDTKTNSTSDILKLLASSKEYKNEGYTGTLALETSSLVTAASGYATKKTPVNKVKEYPGFMYADPSYVPVSIAEDGITLTLTGIDWVVMATALSGDTLIPTEYKAVVNYSGTKQTTYATGYTTTAKYTGIVTKRTVDSVTYTITYIGTLIPVPTTEAPTTAEPTTTEEPETTEPATENDKIAGDSEGLNPILLAALIMAALAALGALIYFLYPKLKTVLSRIKNKTSISVYKLVNEEYILLGNQPLDAVNPVIDLNGYTNTDLTGSFGFVLDKKTSKAFCGRIIMAVYEGETLTHRVTEPAAEYKFKLVFNEYGNAEEQDTEN